MPYSAERQRVSRIRGELARERQAAADALEGFRQAERQVRGEQQKLEEFRQGITKPRKRATSVELIDKRGRKKKINIEGRPDITRQLRESGRVFLAKDYPVAAKQISEDISKVEQAKQEAGSFISDVDLQIEDIDKYLKELKEAERVQKAVESGDPRAWFGLSPSERRQFAAARRSARKEFEKFAEELKAKNPAYEFKFDFKTFDPSKTQVRLPNDPELGKRFLSIIDFDLLQRRLNFTRSGQRTPSLLQEEKTIRDRDGSTVTIKTYSPETIEYLKGLESTRLGSFLVRNQQQRKVVTPKRFINRTPGRILTPRDEKTALESKPFVPRQSKRNLFNTMLFAQRNRNRMNLRKAQEVKTAPLRRQRQRRTKKRTFSVAAILFRRR